MNGDWCTTDGASRLKHKIEQYWRDRGYDVDVDLIDAGFVAAMRSGRTDVRSNMINGMPTRRNVDDDAPRRPSGNARMVPEAMAEAGVSANH